MNTQDIKNILDKSLGMHIGNVSDEWKAPSVVAGESDGEVSVQVRGTNWKETTDLREKVKTALSDKYVIEQGMPEFNSVEFRFWETLKVKEKPQKQ